MQLLSPVLKKEIDEFMGRYNIPSDDKTLLMERIEEEFGNAAKNVATVVGQTVVEERAHTIQKAEDFRRQALGALSDTVGQAKSAVKKAYALGLKEGLGQTSAMNRPSIFQIGMMTGLLAIAGVVVYREFFSKDKEKK
jgi:hypothetical protein